MTREEMRKVKTGDLLTTKYGNIILVERVEFGENAVKVYNYFDYDKEMGIQMNEWLDGFYGPKFDEDFYRYSSDEEKQYFFTELEKYGYILTERYGKAVPTQTPKEYHKHHCKPEPQGLDEAAEELFETIELNEHENIFEGTFKKIFKAGAEWMAGQGVSIERRVDDFGDGMSIKPPTEMELESVGAGLSDKVIVQIIKK